jgi:hypothetical protein
MYLYKKHTWLTAGLLLTLTACGGGTTPPTETTSTGVFIDSPVAGLHYSTATQSGTTNSLGEYDYLTGETVTFSIGGILLGSTLAGPVVTPLSLVAGATSANNPQVTNIVRLLLSLDSDNDPNNGITITNDVVAAADGLTVDFGTIDLSNDVGIISLLSGVPSITLVTDAAAQTHFSQTLAALEDTGTPTPGVPVADAGADQTVASAELVTLSGGGSDSDGSVVSFFWQGSGGNGSSIELADATSSSPTFTAPTADDVIDYVFVLVVTDNDGISSVSDEVTITVSAFEPGGDQIVDDETEVLENVLPVANAGADQTVSAGDVVILDGSESFDSDGNTLTYSWTGLRGLFFSTSSNISQPTFTAPTQERTRTYTFNLIVNDGLARMGDEVIITVLGTLDGSAGLVNFNFDDGTGTDSGGTNQNLIVSGGISIDDDGVKGKALSLSSNSSAVRLPDGIVSALGDFTVASFVRLDRLETWSRIFDFGSGTSNYMFLTPKNGANGNVRFAIKVYGQSEQVVDGNAPLPGGVTSSNVNVISFNNADITLVKLNNSEWILNVSNNSYPCVVESSTESTMTIVETSGFSSMQVNLTQNSATRTINSGGTFDDSVTINPKRVDGYSVRSVRGANGSGLFQKSTTEWIEDNADSNFSWQQTNRTATTVTLSRTAGGTQSLQLVIDLSQNVVNIIVDNGSPSRFLSISSTNASVNENWVHVAVTKSGDLATLYVNGALVGSNPNMTFSPVDLGVTDNNSIGRSQFSSDPNLQASIDDLRIYNRALTAREVKLLLSPDPAKITFMGSSVEVTPQQLQSELASNGFTFVESAQLGSNECNILYASGDGDDISAEVGVLNCTQEFANGEIKLTVQVLYGGCDVARLDQGIGSQCAVGLVSEELTLRLSNNPLVEEVINVAGPAASECTAISSENTCFGAGATVASASIGVKNANGSGIGAGVSVGVGAGFGTQFQDGVLSGSIDLKIGLGISIDYSVSGDDVLEVISLGDSGWIASDDEIIAVGNKGIDAFEGFGEDVYQFGDNAIVEVESAGEELLVFTEDTGQSVDSVFKTIEKAASDAVVETEGFFVTGGQATTRFASNAVNEVRDFFGF